MYEAWKVGMNNAGEPSNDNSVLLWQGKRERQVEKANKQFDVLRNVGE